MEENNWRVVRKIGEGSYGTVYEIERKEFDYVYKAALKVIHIPPCGQDADRVRAQGMDENSITKYYESIARDFVRELELMSRLKGNTNIVSYMDHSVKRQENGAGWDILIRMELLKPLSQYIRETKLSEYDVINIGIDICRALERCHQNGIIHRDVKIDNIFVSDQGDFKLGDFGIARTVERTMAGMSMKGTCTYMAPEVHKGKAYGSSVDIYSLGMVMYRLMNNNRMPFMPPYPEPIRYQDEEEAMVRRMSGERLPMPCNASEEMGAIILKACSYHEEDRYGSAAQMRYALEKLLNTDGFDHGMTDQPEEPMENDQTIPLKREIQNEPAAGKQIPDRKSQPLMLGIIIAVAAVVIIIAVFIMMNGNDKSGTDSIGESLYESESLELPVQTGTAHVGDVVYDTLQEAIDDADGKTVVLDEDITEDIVVSTGSVTLDLNGHRITNISEDTINVRNGAALIIDGDGIVDNVTHKRAAVYNSGTVILNGGTYIRSAENGEIDVSDKDNSFYNILNHGIMTINDPVVVRQDMQTSSLIENGYIKEGDGSERTQYIAGLNRQAPELTINGGTFMGGQGTVKSDRNGTLTINGGTFSKGRYAVINMNITTITDGFFSGDRAVLGNFGNQNNDTQFEAAILNVMGGVYSEDVSEFLNSSYVCVETNGDSGLQYKVVEK